MSRAEIDAQSPQNHNDNLPNDHVVWTGEHLQSSSFMDLSKNPRTVEDRFYRNVLNRPNIRSSLQHLLLQSSSSTTRDYSIQFRAYDILEQDPILGQLLLRYPATLLPVLERAVVRAQIDLLAEWNEQGYDKDINVNGAMVKGQSGQGAATRVHARLVHLPPSRFKSSLSRLEAKDVGQIWQVSGTVVRTSPVQMYESARTYKCKPNKKGGCGRTFHVFANLQQYNNALTPPETCQQILENKKKCGGTNLVPVDENSVHTDYQEIKIQESSSTGSKIGHIPRSLLVKLQHDLVDLCQPGDQVVVVGTLMAQWQSDISVNSKNAPKNARDSAEPDIGLALLAHSIVVLSDESSSSAPSNNGSVSLDDNKKYLEEFKRYWQEEENQRHPILSRDYICRAVCPKLYGLPVIKLALLLALIGGVSAEAYKENHSQNESREPNGVGNGGHVENDNDDDDDDDPIDNENVSKDVTTQNGQTDLFVLAPRNQTNKSKSDAASMYHIYGQGRDTETPTATLSKKSQSNTDNSAAQVYTRRRSQSHLLLVGDPGTGKSQFLRFAAALSPRSVLTTGVGTTSAGLTCAAVRHGKSGEFALEAGALVLADQGVCCIDEFGCIRDSDRTTIHEAMEQQHLSVAKAGIVCKLNSRATIIAVMNPRDCLYDNQTSLSANTGLGTPLLSRFDLIFKLVDTSDQQRDSKITSYLLNQAIYGSGQVFHGANDETGAHSALPLDPWPMDKLRAYIAMVKELFSPILSNNAAVLLEKHYEACRASNSRTIPVTVRFLESLIRLSQAHARLMFRKTVELIDAVAVIRVMECSAFCYGGFDCPSSFEVDNNGNQYHETLYGDPMAMEFSGEPDMDLCCFEYRILKRYSILELMAPGRKEKAEKEIHERATFCQPQSWADQERLLYPTSVPDNYSQNDPQFALPLYGGDNHNLPPARDSRQPETVQPGLSQVQDHYGRTYYTQNATADRTKRRRTSFE